MAARKKKNTQEVDSRYHNTYKLLAHYRDVVWSMELSVSEMRQEFQDEYESSIDEFLDQAYMAGADLSGTHLERHTRTIGRSSEMIKRVDRAVELLRTKHKHGEKYYWVLFYSFLSPQGFDSYEEVIEQLKPHIKDISKTTYYRLRKEAIGVMSDILWGYSSQMCNSILQQFYPEEEKS